MIQQLLKTLIPMMLIRIKTFSLADKQLFARYLVSLGTAFVEGDQDRFSSLLTTMELLPQWKTDLTEALFSDPQDIGISYDHQNQR